MGALLATMALAACGEPLGGYIPVSAIASNGFLKDQSKARVAQGSAIKLWGFVDHGNLYGDAYAGRILEEWWSGEGPSVGTWRFNLKAEANDAVGHSFAVIVPNDPGREELLRRFVTDARAQRPTRVFVKGRLFSFLAPMQYLHRTGLRLELQSSGDVFLHTPD